MGPRGWTANGPKRTPMAHTDRMQVPFLAEEPRKTLRLAALPAILPDVRRRRPARSVSPVALVVGALLLASASAWLTTLLIGSPEAAPTLGTRVPLVQQPASTEVSAVSAQEFVALPPPPMDLRPTDLPPPVKPNAIWQAALHASAAALPPIPAESKTRVVALELRDTKAIALESLQMNFHALVRAPADAKPRQHPLALILHGTHGQCTRPNGSTYCPRASDPGCYPGDKPLFSPAGLVWLAELLARRGYIAVALDAMPLACMSGAPAGAERAKLALAALKRWHAWQKGEPVQLDPAVVQAADLSRLVLVGHSTGADAAMLVALHLQNPRAHGLDGVHVRALALIAPPDSLRPPVPAVPTAIVLPSCDQDIANQAGRSILERAAARADHKSVAVWQIAGATHNALNDLWGNESDEMGWQLCDPQAKLPLDLQRQALGHLLGGFLARPEEQVGALGLVRDKAIDMRVELLLSGTELLIPSRAAGIGLQTLRDCRDEACLGDDRNPQPLWLATWQDAYAEGTWQWAPRQLPTGTRLWLRLATLAPTQADRPTRLTAALVGAQGKLTDVGEVRVLPPIIGGAMRDRTPIVLATYELSVPAGRSMEVQGIRLRSVEVGAVHLAVGALLVQPPPQ